CRFESCRPCHADPAPDRSGQRRACEPNRRRSGERGSRTGKNSTEERATVANRNRGRSVEDDGSTDEPIEDAYDEADLDDDDRAEADAEDEDAAPAGRTRAGAATRERTVSRDRTKRDADARIGIFGRIARRF